MHVVVIGGHGQIALRTQELLTAAGHSGVGVVRNPDHRDDVQATGVKAAVCDLEAATVEDLAPHLRDADAVVFAAGAGPGSGAARKDTVDRAGSVLATDAAERAGVKRFLQISAMGTSTEPPSGTNEVFAAYLRAKTAAEDDLRSRDLDWTVLRPGRLTDGPGTGHVHLAPPPVPRRDVPREDVAAVVAALVIEASGIRRTLELVAGETPVIDAVHVLDPHSRPAG